MGVRPLFIKEMDKKSSLHQRGERDSKRLATRLRFAGLRQQAAPEDVGHRATRGLDRAVFQRLTGGEWIERHQDLLVTGPTDPAS